MQTYYYNLSGRINFSSTKTELGLDTKNIFWSDSENVEILQNRGIIINERKKEETKLIPLVSHLSEVCFFILLPLLVLALMIVLLVFALRY